MQLGGQRLSGGPAVIGHVACSSLGGFISAAHVCLMTQTLIHSRVFFGFVQTHRARVSLQQKAAAAWRCDSPHTLLLFWSKQYEE